MKVTLDTLLLLQICELSGQLSLPPNATFQVINFVFLHFSSLVYPFTFCCYFYVFNFSLFICK